MGEKTVVYNKCNGYKKRNEMKFYDLFLHVAFLTMYLTLQYQVN